jgi:CRISPR-associated protein Cas2
MYLLVTYDVSTKTKAGQRRLQKIAKICKGFGQRVQKSVFECNVDDVHYELFKKQLLDLIDAEKDGLRIYHLHGRPDKFVEEYGKGRSIDYQKPLVL